MKSSTRRSNFVDFCGPDFFEESLSLLDDRKTVDFLHLLIVEVATLLVASLSRGCGVAYLLREADVHLKEAEPCQESTTAMTSIRL